RDASTAVELRWGEAQSSLSITMLLYFVAYSLLCTLARGRRTSQVNRAFAEHDPQLLPPALVDPQKLPFNLGRQIAQDRIRRRMHAQRRRHQHQKRLFRGDFAAREISELRKLSTALVPGHSRPVIHSLQRQVDVLVRLEFDHGQAPVASCRENVNHCPTSRREGGPLPVHAIPS